MLVLASCATAPLKPVDPGVTVPGQWLAGHSSAAAVEDFWWQTFDNAALTAAVEEALRNNHDIEAAAARLDAALAEARIAGADLMPRLSANFDATRAQRNFIGFPIPGGGDRVLTTRTTAFDLGLNSSWELDLWGRIRSGKKAAVVEVMASRSELAGVHHSLAAQTAKAWMNAVEARQQSALAEATVESYRLTARQVRDRYERGLRPPLDVRLAQANLKSAEAFLAEQRARLAIARRQLEILMGRYPAGALETAPDLPPVPPEVPAGLPAELLSRRPDVAAAEERVRAAEARVSQARASLYPRISLTATGGRSSSELSDLLSGDFTVWSIAANLAQPVFEGGRLRAGVRRAQAQSREATARFQSAALRAFREVESALAAEGLLARRETELNAAAEESKAALHLAGQRYRRGLENFTTVLEAQRRVLEADTQRVAVRHQRLETRIDLHLALGGGFFDSSL